MLAVKQDVLISEADYLEGEKVSEIKHEYIDGYVYAMSGASINHSRIAGNVYRKIGNHLEGKPCQPYTSDVKVKIGSKYFYPDVMVDCADSDGYYTETPVIIVEVLSKSTRRTDQTIKRLAYTQIATLQEYVLIEQDFVDVEVIRRSNGWQSEHFYLGDEVTLKAIGLTLTVEEIYTRVKNEDMSEWLEKQQALLQQESSQP